MMSGVLSLEVQQLTLTSAFISALVMFLNEAARSKNKY